MLAKMRYGKYLCKMNRPLPHREAASMGKGSFPEPNLRMSADLPKGYKASALLLHVA